MELLKLNKSEKNYKQKLKSTEAFRTKLIVVCLIINQFFKNIGLSISSKRA